MTASDGSASRVRAIVAALLCAACLTLVLERPAFAQSKSERAQAAALKRKGDAEMDLLHYAEALASYSEAYELIHDPALLYNRARVLEALERFADALDSLERFSAEAPPEMRARVPKLKELLADLGSRVTKLFVKCTVAKARVLVRDKQVGMTPFDGPVRVNAGTAELEVLADGYAPFKKTIVLPNAGELVVEVALAAREPVGELVVASSPDGANVTIDGKPYGIAPVEARLVPGNHVLVLGLAGYRDKETTAVVVEGERRRAEVSLDKRPPITATWWFWTGVGVLVVGATVVTLAVAFNTEKSAGQGDIPPGQVSGPLRF